MPHGLKRYQESGQSHFLTFSCYHRLPLLARGTLRDVFLKCLEKTRRKYQCMIYGYVVMPEHVHLLMSESEKEVLATAIQALKVSFIRQSEGFHAGTFWQKRYYDHNVRDHESFVDKLRYMHRNPVSENYVRHQWTGSGAAFGTM